MLEGDSAHHINIKLTEWGSEVSVRVNGGIGK